MISLVARPDYPKTMREFCERFTNPKACLKHLAALRWPDGFVCPKCGGIGGWLKEERFLYRCKSCKHDTSPMAGTAMHRSRVAIQDWFWAAYVVATHTPGLSAKQLQRYLGTSSYETAWYLLQRFRRAMVNDSRSPLAGVVEADETIVGGPAKGKAGRGTTKAEHKSLVLGTVEVLPYKDKHGKNRKRAGRVRLQLAQRADAVSIEAFLRKNLVLGTQVCTDGWKGYSDNALKGYRHIATVQDSPESASRLAPHIHRVFANLKTWLLGTHHGVEPKYLQGYLDEYVFRFNRRQTPMAAFQTLLGITVAKKPRTMENLRLGE
jgi:hypothetical protein